MRCRSYSIFQSSLQLRTVLWPHARSVRARPGCRPAASCISASARSSMRRITLIEYGPDGLRGDASSSRIAASRAFTPTQPVLWLNVYGLHEPEVMAEIGRRFNLHPLVLEDILNTDQRPKLDDYGDYLFLVARFFDYDDKTMTVSSEQVSIVIGHQLRADLPGTADRQLQSDPRPPAPGPRPDPRSRRRLSCLRAARRHRRPLLRRAGRRSASGSRSWKKS